MASTASYTSFKAEPTFQNTFNFLGLTSNLKLLGCYIIQALIQHPFDC